MKVLLLHNRYRQPGGEDTVFQAESAMLQAQGVDVVAAGFDNGHSNEGRRRESLQLVLGAAWSRRSYNEVRRLCEQVRPDVVHVHNFWMRLSPSVHAACHAAHIPTVQTLHNFRLLCPNSIFLRDGAICEACLGNVPWRGIVHRCYRESWVASSVAAGMILVNQIRGTWENDVDAFIALSEHAREKFIAGGLPAERVFVKANFRPDPGEPVERPSRSNDCLYVGRLSREKGLSTLLAAWAVGGWGTRGRLVIAGEGPERASLENQVSSLGLGSSVYLKGHLSQESIRNLISQSRCVVMPSLWYEGFPMAIIEAFSHGRPAVVSSLGALPSIVDHGRTGLTFTSGNAPALGEALRALLTDDSLVDSLGAAARQEYLNKYTPERNFPQLMHIYQFVLSRASSPLAGTSVLSS